MGQSAGIREGTLGAVVRARAVAAPHGAALLALGAPPLTAAALRQQLDHTEDVLRSCGVGPTDRVLLSLGYGPTAAAALVATAACCAAVPRDPELSATELAPVLDAVRPVAALVDRGASGAVRAEAVARGICLFEVAPEPGGASGAFRLTPSTSAGPGRAPAQGAPTPDDVAVVLQTSGTSGVPKQVPLTHAECLAGAEAMAALLGLGAEDRAVHLSPLFNVAGLVAPLLAPLVSGGGAVVCGPFDPGRFFAAVEDHGATWWNAGPTIQRALRQAVVADPERWAAVRPQLRLTRCGSAPLSADALSDLEEAYGIPVLHAYGMTEVAQIVTCNRLDPGGRRPGSAGLPVVNEVRVAADDGSVAPAGTWGEVQVRGPSVFSGYLGDPAATAAAFVDGWFRTGDLGALDADGFLTLRGRLSEIVNRGGQLVAPAEVDAAALSHPSVVEAAAFPIPHPSLGHDLGLAVVTADGAVPPDLVIHLARHLTLVKRPRRIDVVASIPRTATNKPRRDQLAATVLAAHRAAAGGLPHDGTEARVARHWTAVVGASPAGRDEDFFLAGGDSLQAITLLALVEDDLGAEVGIAAFLDAPTVAGLAAAVEAHPADAPAARAIQGLRPDGPRLPVVLFSGLGGAAVTVSSLAADVPDGHLVVAVEALGLHGGRHPRHLATAATQHLRDLAPVLRGRPCLLVGYSLGSLVALEAAAQLEVAGQPCAVVLIDGWPPSHRRDRRRQKLLKLHLRALQRALRRAGTPHERRIIRVREARRRARLRMQAPSVGSPLWVLASPDRQARWGADLGWAAELGRPVSVVAVPGRHLELCREPAVVRAVADVATEADALLRTSRQATAPS